MAEASTILLNTTVSGSTLRITRGDGQFWETPPNTWFTETGLKRRVQIRDRVRADGGTEVGDETYRPRSYSLAWDLNSTDPTAYRSKLNEIQGWFRRDKKPYYLTDVPEGVRVEFVPGDHSVVHPVGNRNATSTNTLIVLAKNSLWESVDEFGFPGGAGSQTGDAITGGTGTGAESGVGVLMQDEDEITITNNGTENAFPVFYIVAQNNVINFTLRNLTADGAFTFDSNQFTSGKTLRVGSVDGSIDIFTNGTPTDESRGLTAGGRLPLLPGENVIKYESTGGDITLEAVWRERFGY